MLAAAHQLCHHMAAGVSGGACNQCCHHRTPLVLDDAKISTTLEVKGATGVRRIS
ncbi:hypothetical protein BTZ20_4497 [Rhodococcus sp. MTM3W5.2]|nr:hypothetical protein BTZ20_4497 [Rhodococcus sp. MTM3W5.2]